MGWEYYCGVNISFNLKAILLSIKFIPGQEIIILIENNGRESSSKITKHIKAHNVFIKDHIYQGGVEVKYLPTE